MAVVAKTIGSGGYFSTIALWEADSLADSTIAAGNTYKGECLNQEFTITSPIYMAGNTTTSSAYKWLSTASGASFRDNANKLTNALRYNASNGAGITTTTPMGTYIGLINVGDASETHDVVDNLQIQHAGTHSSSVAINLSSSTTVGCKVKNCILQTTSYQDYTVQTARCCELINCLIIHKRHVSGLAGIKGWYLNAGGGAYNCTIVRPNGGTGTLGTPIKVNGSTYIVKNCAAFGFSEAFSGTFDGSSGYNATDLSSAPGSNNQVSKTYSAQFQNYSDGSEDFRAKAGCDFANGTPDSTHTAGVDIVGQTRSGTTPYIGAWEIVAAGGLPTLSSALLINATTTSLTPRVSAT